MSATQIAAVLLLAACLAPPVDAQVPQPENPEARNDLIHVALILDGDVFLKGTFVTKEDGPSGYGTSQWFAEPWPEDLGPMERAERRAKLSSKVAPTVLLLLEGADENCDGTVTQLEAQSYGAAFRFGILADYVCQQEGPERARTILSKGLRGITFEASVLRYRRIVSELRFRHPFPMPTFPSPEGPLPRD